MVRAGFAGRMGPPHRGGSGSSLSLLNPAFVNVGDSIVAAINEKSIADFTNFFCDGRLVPVVGYNQGVSGNKTDDVIARLSTIKAVVSGYTGHKLARLAVGTNDIVLGGYSSATTITNLSTILTDLLTVYDAVLLSTILPRAGANALTGPQELTRGEINDWIRARTDPRIIVSDLDLCGFDPATMTTDGLHPFSKGVALISDYLAADLSPSLAANDVLASASGQLFSNGNFSGTSGTHTSSGAGATDSGTVATGYQGRNFIPGVAAVFSVGVDDFGNPAQIVTLNGTVTTAGNCEIRRVETYSGTAGQSYEFMGYAKVTCGGVLRSLYAQCDGTLIFGGTTITPAFDRDFEGVIRSGRTTLGGTDTSNDAKVNLYFEAGDVLVDVVLVVSRWRWRLNS